MPIKIEYLTLAEFLACFSVWNLSWMAILLRLASVDTIFPVGLISATSAAAIRFVATGIIQSCVMDGSIGMWFGGDLFAIRPKVRCSEDCVSEHCMRQSWGLSGNKLVVALRGILLARMIECAIQFLRLAVHLLRCLATSKDLVEEPELAEASRSRWRILRNDKAGPSLRSG